MSLPLNHDIWHNVVEHLSADGFNSAIRQLSLTCRALVPISHSQTFRTVCFQSDSGARWSLAPLEDRIRAFIDLALSRPQILQWVRELVLSSGRPNHDWLHSEPMAEMLKLFKSRSHIRSLTLESTCSVPLIGLQFHEDMWSSIGASLKAIRLDNIMALDFSNVTASSPHLEKLYLGSIETVPPFINPSTIPRLITSLQVCTRPPTTSWIVRGRNIGLANYFILHEIRNASFTTDSYPDVEMLVEVLDHARYSLRALRVDVEGWLPFHQTINSLDNNPLSITDLHLTNSFGRRGEHPSWALVPISAALDKLYCTTLSKITIEIRYSVLGHFASLIREDAPWSGIDRTLRLHTAGPLTVEISLKRLCTFDKDVWQREVVDRFVGSDRFDGMSFMAGDLLLDHIPSLLPLSSKNDFISFSVVRND